MATRRSVGTAVVVAVLLVCFASNGAHASRFNDLVFKGYRTGALRSAAGCPCQQWWRSGGGGATVVVAQLAGRGRSAGSHVCAILEHRFRSAVSTPTHNHPQAHTSPLRPHETNAWQAATCCRAGLAAPAQRASCLPTTRSARSKTPSARTTSPPPTLPLRKAIWTRMQPCTPMTWAQACGWPVAHGLTWRVTGPVTALKNPGCSLKSADEAHLKATQPRSDAAHTHHRCVSAWIRLCLHSDKQANTECYFHQRSPPGWSSYLYLP